MTNATPVSELFLLIAQLAKAQHAEPLNQYPECWECTIDEQWWLAVNGHAERKKSSQWDQVPPFHACVMFNGWPAGCFDPHGGSFVVGTVANEDAFAAALKAAIAKAEGRS